jgi:transcription initiation factor TFIIH subunit 3
VPSIGAPPSLLVLILDTNPHAWSLLSPYITLSSAIAQLLIFLNAHLASNNDNRVAVLASHTNKTRWLYPSAGNEKTSASTHTATADANKYRPFALLEQELLANLRELMSSTIEDDLKTNGKASTTTLIAGALTRALSYINRLTLSLTPTSTNPAGTNSSTSNPVPFDSTGANGAASATTASLATHVAQTSHLNSKVLIVSTSGDLAGQYIPLMNLIFAAQHARIPVDVLKLAGDTVLLQQASYTTQGVFLSPVSLPSLGSANANGHEEGKQISILPTLLHAFLPDPLARTHLIPATGISVDFRAACFCHRKVVDVGYVCSICLSIFCAQLPILEGGRCVCWTCGTKLRLDGAESGNAGGGEARKKKRKRVAVET